MLHINHDSNATNTKYLGLGNKSGVGGTHRHSLEKLKEYESQLLMSSTAANTNDKMRQTHTNSNAGIANQRQATMPAATPP